MNNIILSAAALLLVLTSCSTKDRETVVAPSTANNVLLLKVDYTTNAFEGGKEFAFSKKTSTFSINHQYVPPGDFGSLKLTYQELQEPLFDGTVVWMGRGEIHFPKNMIPPENFEYAPERDVISPGLGFENIFNPDNMNFDYYPVWTSIQGLKKVREYLQTNPNATVKLFLYTPSVGVGDPLEWDWIVFIKN